jgi:polyphosphate kinase
MGNIELNLNYTKNRELSWLKFNERVLEEAVDSTVPLIERLKFISIFQTNLDEFFMIRVGSIFSLMQLNSKEEHEIIDPRSGINYREQLDKVFLQTHLLNKKKDLVFKDVESKLRVYGIYSLGIKELNSEEYKYVKKYYKEFIAPILSPQIVDSHHPFPHLPNKLMHIGAMLHGGKKKTFALIPIPTTLPRSIMIPSNETKFITIEKVILHFVNSVFAHYKLDEVISFCVTRDGDINFEDNDDQFDINIDFRRRMKTLLKKRRRLQVVRLEISNEISATYNDYLCKNFKIRREQVFVCEAPMILDYAYSVEKMCKDRNIYDLVFKPFNPRFIKRLDYGLSIMDQVLKKDIFLSFPYDSMETYLLMMKQAASDPTVLSIKITIYRVAKTAKLIEYLCIAAENGKDVTALIELRARFDEQNNIDWSERLEESGVKIQYGFDGYKVHSKITLITRRVNFKIQHLTQVGTGNYNENTAKLYTDLCLITANEDIGRDANKFFNNMGIANIFDGDYDELLVSPMKLKNKVIDLIKEQAQKGKEGRIMLKLNSITDVDIIFALKEASCAGCEILLIIRGICCILPEVENATENIIIKSVVGRYLEHSRIYSFGEGEYNKMYLSSADFMTRNTEHRVEVACPIYDEEVKIKINKIIEHIQKDNLKARKLCEDGNYVKCNNFEKANYDAQRELMLDSERYNDLEMNIENNKTKKSFFSKFFDIFK